MQSKNDGEEEMTGISYIVDYSPEIFGE